MYPTLFQSDLDEIIRESEPSFSFFKNKSIFITGGTGFFGNWLVQSLLAMNDKRDLNCEIGVLSRSSTTSAESRPWLKHPSIQLFDGDIRSFNFPDRPYDIVIHAAVAASAALLASDPKEMLETNILGTQRALEFTEKCGAKTFLLTSSGAVYGNQPQNLANTPENYLGAPSSLEPSSAYAEGKRCSELMSVLFGKTSGIDIKIARCYGYVAPYLPLTTHFAVGNFIQNCLRGEDIIIKADGSPFRSYMYGTDLVTWLLRVTSHGENNRAYNIGAEEPISIRNLAFLVQKIGLEEIPTLSAKATAVHIALPLTTGKPAERYVPSVQRAKEELGLKIVVSTHEAIRRTFKWNLG